MRLLNSKKNLSAKEEFKLKCNTYKLKVYEQYQENSRKKDLISNIIEELINCTTVKEMNKIYDEICMFEEILNRKCNNEKRNTLNQYLYVIEQVKVFINAIKSNEYEKIKIRMGLDKNNDLICFIMDLNEFLSSNDKSIFKAYVMGRDSVLENNERFDNVVFMNWRFIKDKDYQDKTGVKLLNIKIRGNKERLGWGSFALKSLEDIIIENINDLIDIYNKEITDDEELIGKINTIYGESKPVLSVISDNGLKNFYIKNKYTFYETDKFRKELNYSKS